MARETKKLLYSKGLLLFLRLMKSSRNLEIKTHYLKPENIFIDSGLMSKEIRTLTNKSYKLLDQTKVKMIKNYT